MNINLDVSKNDFINIAVLLFIMVYAAGLGRMKLPKYIEDLFNNPLFKVFFLFLIVGYNINKAPHVALIIAIAFVFTLEYVNHNMIRENFAYLEFYQNQSNGSKQLHSQQ